MKVFSRNKWLALCLVMVLIFTLMPMNYDMADERNAPAEETSENDLTKDSSETVGTGETLTETAFVSEQIENTEVTTEKEVLSMTSRVEDSDVTSESTASDDLDTMAGKKNLLEEETLNSKLAGTSSDLLNHTTIRLDKLTLEGVYKDTEGKTQVVNITTTETTTLPNDATIDMSFNFVMGDGNAVDCSKEYVYKIPESIRVDVNATHELMDGDGKSIGCVAISKEGTLTFTFYESAIQNQEQIPFYVKFSGGFSSHVQENIGAHDISFPTASGEFTYKVDVTKSNQDKENDEPGELKTYKSGTKVYKDGKSYIQWTVEVDLNGRDSLTADVMDILPAGLTYVTDSAVLNGEGNASASVTESIDGNKVTFHIKDSKPYWRTNLTFLTGYDENIFPAHISNSSGVTVNNTVAVNPNNEETGVEGSGSVYITPTVLEKSGTLDAADASITWTVTINKDQFDIAGTTYTDIFGEGMTLDADFGASGFEVSPAGAGTITSAGTGFIFTADGSRNTNTITIVYKTKVDNISQSNFNNKGTLTGGNYDASIDANVSGMNLVQKAAKSYNEITKQFTWTITVNEAGIELKDAVVKDIFDSKKMTFVSATVANADGVEYDGAMVSGNQISLGTIQDKKTITVVTQLNEIDTIWDENGWYQVNNKATLEWDENQVSSDANMGFQYKVPDLLDKDGVVTENGTIQWTLSIKQPQLKQEKLKIEDVLPTGMEYVTGTFKLMYYTYAWDSSQMMYVTPVYDSNSNMLSYEFDRDGISDSYYMDNAFVIQYETKLKDRTNASQNTSYTNHAKLVVDYEGDVRVTDTASKTVDGIVGGTLGKEYAYASGNNYVDWSVMINEAGYDMSDVQNPMIKDKLEDYFDYVSGDLYKIVNGTRQEVPESEYVVVIINNNITVKLPAIGTDTYVFAFRTQFNISSAKLESMAVKNTVNFTGDGYAETASSDEVNNISFSSSSAGSVLEKELRIKKVDSVTGDSLKGAVFELFYKGVSCGTATTGDDGFAVFTGVSSDITGVHYTLHEEQAPDGYVKSDGDMDVIIYEGNLKTDASGVRYIEYEVTNETLTKNTQINIYKTGLNHQALAGAEFSLYRDAACTSLIGKRTTGADGMAVFSVEYKDTEAVTYYIKETGIPDGYLAETVPAVYSATIAIDGTVAYSLSEITVGALKALPVTNSKAYGALSITKVKAEGNSDPIGGVKFAIYLDAECNDLVDEQITDSNGKILFSDLELGTTYYYREMEAASGYVLDSTIHSITIGDGTEHEHLTESVTVENTEALGFIAISKTDNSIPAVPIAGVEFTLYEQNGTTPYKKSDGENYVVTTDSAGKAVFENLPFRTYVVKETNTKQGYQVGNADTSVEVNSTGGNKVNIINKVLTFDINLTKINDENPAKRLPGVTFVLYTKSGKAVTSGKTDVDGELTFSEIPYGDYYVKETAGVKGYIVSGDIFEIPATDITQQDQILSHTFVNKKESGNIEFKKKAEDAGGSDNYLKDAEFTIYNSHGLKVADEVSDDNGVVSFQDLIYDTYTIQETKAPADYKLDNTVWTVTVAENKTYTKLYKVLDPNTGYTELDNEKLPGDYKFVSFLVKKTDQDAEALKGAKFELSKQIEGSNDWTLMATAYSDDNGVVQFHNITIEQDVDTTKYKLEEVTAPTGYKLDSANATKVYTYSELTEMQMGGSEIVGHINKKNETELEKVPLIVTVANQQMLGSIRVLKTGLTSLITLSGAEFTLYESDGVTAYTKADGAVYSVTTDKNGIAVFENLPVGYYVLKETGAPQGYTLNTLYAPSIQILDETVQDVTFTDTQLSVFVSKQASGGGGELAGAELAVYDSQNVLLETWTTTDVVHKLTSSNLKVGETYKIKEIKAPNGYRSGASVQFVINQDGTLTYLEGEGSVNGKTAIILDAKLELNIKKVDGATDDHLNGALLEIIDEETGSPIYSFTSDGSTKNIPYHLLKAPDQSGEYMYYTIHEKSAPSGYELAEDIRIAISFDGKIYQVNGENRTLASNPIVMSDKIKQNFYFNKTDAGAGNRLSGATLEITEQDGTLVKSWTSGSAPKNLALSDGTYIFKEVSAPNGYIVADPITFSVSNGKMTIINGDFSSLSYDQITISMKDAALNVKVRKVTESFAVLPEAAFDLYESDANGTKGIKLESFVTTNNAMALDSNNLKTGTWYLLVETKAPNGYELAEPVLFYIDKDGIVQNQFGEVYDSNLIEVRDMEKQLCVQKIDAVKGSAVIGVKLSITSKEDAGFQSVDWVTDGNPKYFPYSKFEYDKTYTLSELQTVNGYTYASSIDFMISSDDDVVYSNGKAMEGNRIVMENTGFEVLVSKMSDGTKDSLAGATLAVKDADGNILEQWVSDRKPHKLDTTKLHVSLNNEYVYTLCELQAPEGYALAQPISFILDRNGKVKRLDGEMVTDYTIIMEDEYQGIIFSKQDEGGKEISGATLTITSTEDKEFVPVTWRSTDTVKNWNKDMFKPNTDYILTETEAPKGYTYAKSITFRLDDAGVVYVNGKAVADQTVRMVDAKLNLLIAKRIKGTDKYLSGAKLSIVEQATGTVVYTWKTKSENRKIPAKCLTASKEGERVIYVLTEIKAPEGYKLAEDICFYIDQNGNIYTIDKDDNETLVSQNTITMYDAEDKATKAGSRTDKNARTGDNNPIEYTAYMMLISMGAFLTLLYWKKKRH